MSTGSDAGEATTADKTVSVSSPTADTGPTVGVTHGRYVVLEELGRGGMGKVVRAYDPKLHREVALKLLRSEADPVARARIAREAQAMAQLSHPNVVAIYDVEVESDRPFIAMEIVEGTTLREWVREASPSWREIVEAFLAAGEGLAAAHAAGMVHRDFKPANVLRSDEGRIRVMDFGIARTQDMSASQDAVRLDAADTHETTGELAESSPPRSSSAPLPTLTLAGTVVGTPAYMAPEQHLGKPADARTDQYSFCIALWEALTGQRPFEGQLAQLVAAKSARHLSARETDRPLPSHLRPILLRGLAPSPDDRYPSMQLLLSALQRDPGRRRRWLAACGVTATVAAGWMGAGWLEERRAQHECDAQGSEIQSAWNDDIRDRVRVAFEATEAVYAAEQLGRVLPRIDDFAAAWHEHRKQACQAVFRDERGAQLQERADACFAEARSALDAQVEILLAPDAEVVRHAVDGVRAMPSPEACNDEVALARRIELPRDPATREEIASIRAGLERVAARRRVGQYAEALELSTTLVERAEAVGWKPIIAKTLQILSSAAGAAGEIDRAIETGQRAFFTASEIGHDHVAQMSARYISQLLGSNKTRTDRALLWNDIALTLHKRLGADDDLMLADTLNARGAVLLVAGRYDDAMAAHARALELREHALPPDHPIVCGSLTNLGMTLYDKGEYDKALEIHQSVLNRTESALGPTHPDLVELYNKVGITYEITGEYQRALEYLEKALSIAEASMPGEHPVYGDIYNNLGNVYTDLGQYERSRDVLLQALKVYEQTDGPRSMSVGRSYNNLANAHATLGEFETSFEYQKKSLEIFEEVLGPKHGFCGMVRDNMGVVLRELGRTDEALEAFRTGLEIREEAFGKGHPDVALSLLHLAGEHQKRNEHAQAIAAFERALEIRAQQNTAPEILADLQSGLAVSLWDSETDRERAIEMATAARDGYAQAGQPREESRQRMDDWLRERN